MTRYSKILTCRVCKNSNLKLVGSLGNIAISDFTEIPQEGNKMYLDLVECQQCKLVQLWHDPPVDLLYRDHYWYKSATNPVIANDLAEIVREAWRQVKMKKHDIFLDIGANDGTLLKNVSRLAKRIGIEPAKNLLQSLKKSCDVAINDFWENVELEKKAKIITAIGMFYDSTDPNKFMAKVKDNLVEDGIFVAQLMTLVPMLKKYDVGNICHEHIEYYSYKSLVELYERNGLEIYRVEENSINGGSYRLWARHKVDGSIDYPEEYDLNDFFEQIAKNKFFTKRYIQDQVDAGRKVYVYAGSTKGNTILQYYGLDTKLISGVAEKDKTKWGKYTVNTGIPIFNEAEIRDDADIFFVMPFGFIDSFVEKERDFISKGGKLIVCTPKFRIYDQHKG